jgi:two-component system, LytTR family, sensor kinase
MDLIKRISGTDNSGTKPFLYFRKYRVLSHIVFWVWVFLIDVFIFGVGYDNVPKFTDLALLEIPGTVLLAYTTAYWILPRYLKNLNHLEALGVFLVVFLLNGLIGHTLLYITGNYTPDIHFGNIPRILLMAFYCFLKSCFFIGIKVVIDWHNTQRAMNEMEKSRLESELKMLKDQVNPHFMFNTLNNLYGLITKNPLHAQESVLGLSGILHYMLYESNHEKVSVLREIQCIKDYIELEKLRYPGNLSVSVNVQKEVEKLVILPLSLFPFVENSFKHGASEVIEEAWINIDFSVYKNDFIFKIENSRLLSNTKTTSDKGIGLSNVKRRLELMYGKAAHDLQIMDGDESFLVVLKIDLKTMINTTAAKYENEMSYR